MKNPRYVDITGQRFGRLIAQTPIIGSAPFHWLCVCDCGNTKEVRGTALRSNHIKSCGCLRVECNWETTPVNLIGLTFGRLTVKKESKDAQGRRAWICKCQCGKKTTVRTGLLSSGNTKSCGCGQSGTPPAKPARKKASSARA